MTLVSGARTAREADIMRTNRDFIDITECWLILVRKGMLSDAQAMLGIGFP